MTTSTRDSALLPRALVAVGALLAGAAAPAAAQWGVFDSEFDEQKKSWSEIEAKLPGAPGAGNLIPFAAGAATAHRFYVDAASLSVGEDGVVRYTVLVKAAGGATNVSFEGIRCETREQKLYAVGRGDGKWVRARDSAWRRIERQDLNPYHSVLYSDFLCPDPRRMTNVKQIVEALRRESVRLR